MTWPLRGLKKSCNSMLQNLPDLRIGGFNPENFNNMQDAWKTMKPYGLVVVGPIGAYIVYYLVFVARYVSLDQYPLLYKLSRAPDVWIDIAIAACVLGIVATCAYRLRGIDNFKPARDGLPLVALIMAVAGVAVLLLLSIYRVLGTLNPEKVIRNYADYQFLATYGGAWIIHACYAALYLMLLDMYYSGVKRANGAAFLAAVLIVAFSGGRGLLILFVLTFLVLLMLQNVKWLTFTLVAALSSILMASSFITVTDMRDTRATQPEIVKPGLPRAINPEKLKPEDSFEDLNYNAAFVQEDVLRAFRDGRIKPAPYVLEDAKVRLTPRFMMPGKPVSTAETMALYPDVAARGTNITFPLKANLMMHFGPIGFWLDWLVVLVTSLIFLAGAAQRAKSPVFWSFAAIFLGCSFILIARAGILNARLMDQVLDITLAYVGYRIALWFFTRKSGNTQSAY